MYKKLSIPLLFVLVLAYLYAYVSIELKSLKKPLEKTLAQKSSAKIEFKDIRFRFFNRISVSGIKIGNLLYAKEVTFFINPFHMARDFKNPEQAIDSVLVEGAKIEVNDELKGILSGSGVAGKGGLSLKSISFKRSEIRAGGYDFKKIRGRLGLDKEYKLKASFYIDDKKISLEAQADKDKPQIKGEAHLTVSGSGLNAEIFASGNKYSNGVTEAFIKIPLLNGEGITLDNSSAKVSYSKSGLKIRYYNMSGLAQFETDGRGNLKAGAKMKLDKILKGVTGRLDFSLEKSTSSFSGDISLNNLNYLNSPAGGASFSFRTNPDKSITGKGKVAPVGYEISLKGSAERGFTIEAKSGPRTMGRFFGVKKPKGFEFTLSKWPLENMPFLANFYPGIKGTVDSQGKFDDAQSAASFVGRDCAYKDSGLTSFQIDLFRAKDLLFYKAKLLDQTLNINGRYVQSGDWQINSQFNNFQVKKISSWAKLPVNLDGLLSGTFRYNSDKSGFLKATMKNLVISDNFFESSDLIASFNADTVNIIPLTLYSRKGAMTLCASIGLNPYWGHSYFNARFYKFPYKGTLINCKVSASGDIFTDENTHFSGQLEAAGITVRDFRANSLKTLLDISKDRMEFKNIVIDNLINGDYEYVFQNRVMNGNFYFADFPVSYFSRDLSGLLEGRLTLRKTFENPEINFSYSSPHISYKGLNFGNSAKFRFDNGAFSGEDIIISSGTSSLAFRGKIWPELKLKGRINYLSVPFLEGLLNRKIPLRGGFAGKVELDDSIRDPKIKLSINAAGLYYGGNRVPQCLINLAYQNGVIIFDKLNAKCTDSEVFFDEGSRINLKENKYSLRLQLRNFRLGPVTVFGGINSSGEWYEKEGKYGVRGVVETKKFWINQHSLQRTILGFDYFNNAISFGNFFGVRSQAQGKIGFTSSSVRFDDFRLTRGKEVFAADGRIGAKKWDFELASKNLSAATLTEIANFPVTFTGSMNAVIKGKGSLDRPQVTGNILISSGTLTEMPFSALRLNFSVRDDILRVSNSGMVLRDAFGINISGSAPFYLTKASKKRVMKKNIDLEMSIDKGTLPMFNGLTSDLNFSKGDLSTRVTLTGTYSKPSLNGVFKVANGETGSARYFKKLRDLNINLSLKNGVLKVNEFSCKIGDGFSRLTGSVIFDGLNPSRFDLHWRTEGSKGVSIVVPELPIPTPLVKTGEKGHPYKPLARRTEIGPQVFGPCSKASIFPAGSKLKTHASRILRLLRERPA